jgi:nitrogen fixation/metabolism regulation signal transduction histidine kinase
MGRISFKAPLLAVALSICLSSACWGQKNAKLCLVLLGLLIVLIASAMVFYSTRRVLRHIKEITEAASRIGEADLSSRVPTT